MKHDFESFIGMQRNSEAYIDPWNARALGAVLDLEYSPGDGEDLPSLWHWLYFLETAPQSKIGEDGHPQKGDFLPPIENPRRMFAGARTEYKKPLQIGLHANLVETIAEVKVKEGGQGILYIVTVLYEYSQAGQPCISEERDFIYLPAAEAPGALPTVTTELTPLETTSWELNLDTDAVLLFRFSALTFNSHKIHTDLHYAQTQEAYPALVLHGPLSAILMSECVRANTERIIGKFSFRAMAPLFCGQQMRVRGGELEDNNSAELLVYTPDAQPALKASVEFAG